MFVFSENARVTRIKLDEISIRTATQVRDSDHINEKHTRIRQQKHGTVVINRRAIILGHSYHNDR